VTYVYGLNEMGELSLPRRNDCGNIYGHDPLKAKERRRRYLETFLITADELSK